MILQNINRLVDKVENLEGRIQKQSEQLESQSEQLESQSEQLESQSKQLLSQRVDHDNLKKEIIKIKNINNSAGLKTNNNDSNKLQNFSIRSQQYGIKSTSITIHSDVPITEDKKNPDRHELEEGFQPEKKRHLEFKEELTKQHHNEVTKHLPLCDNKQHLIAQNKTTARVKVAERKETVEVQVTTTDGENTEITASRTSTTGKPAKEESPPEAKVKPEELAPAAEDNPATQQQEVPTTVKSKGITTFKQISYDRPNIILVKSRDQCKVPQLLSNDSEEYSQPKENIYLKNSDAIVPNIEPSWNNRDRENMIKELSRNDHNFDEKCNPYHGCIRTVYSNEHNNNFFSKEFVNLPSTNYNDIGNKPKRNNSHSMHKIFNLATQLKEPNNYKPQISTIEKFCHGYNLTEPNVKFRLRNNCAADHNRFENGFYRNKLLLQVF